MELKAKMLYMCDKCHKPIPRDEHWKISENYGGYGASTKKKWDLCNECYKLVNDFVNDSRPSTQKEIIDLFPIYKEE